MRDIDFGFGGSLLLGLLSLIFLTMIFGFGIIWIGIKVFICFIIVAAIIQGIANLFEALWFWYCSHN